MRFTPLAFLAIAGCTTPEVDLDLEETEQAIENPEDPPIERHGPITPAPSALVIDSNYGGRQMTVRWQCGGNAEYNQNLFSVSGGPWQSGDLSCYITHLFGVDSVPVQPDTAYCFKVRAWNHSHQAFSSTVCERSDIYREPPATPSISSTARTDRIELRGVDRADIESGYRLYRRRGSTGSWGTPIYSRGPVAGVGGAIAYDDFTVEHDTRYQYKLDAWHPWSTSSATTSEESWPTRPEAPSNVRFSAIEPTAVTVAWNDNSFNEDGFRIEYSAPFWGSHSETVPYNTTHLRIPVGSDTVWSFRIVSFNEAGTRASTYVTVTTPPTPTPTPTQPDLVPYQTDVNPAFPEPGEAFSFRWQECNTGGTASGSSRTVVQLDGTVVHDARYSLAAKTCIWRSLQHSGLGVGSHWFDVQVDANAEIVEASEANNTNSNQFVVD